MDYYHTLLRLLLTLLALLTFGAKTTESKSRDRTLRISFLNSTAFANTVTSIVQKKKDADLYCKEKHGHFFYYSYTGNCESCRLHCTDVLPDMKHECFDKCEDFLKINALVRRIEMQEEKIKRLEHGQAKEKKDSETRDYISYFIFGLLYAALLLGVVVLFYRNWQILKDCEKIYMKRENQQPSSDSLPPEKELLIQ